MTYDFLIHTGWAALQDTRRNEDLVAARSRTGQAQRRKGALMAT